jgi:hypothetical protein
MTLDKLQSVIILIGRTLARIELIIPPIAN